MVDAVETVKPARRYDGARRRARAEAAQQRIVHAAAELFLSEGYAATTVTAVATAARVSVDTIYKTFGGKPGLVRAIWADALRGAQPVPAEVRSDRLQAEERDPHRIVAGWARLVAELAPRAFPVILLIRTAAATDPELLVLLRELDDARLRRMAANARRLQRAGHLRAGVTVGAATDVLWTYSSPELYELLVVRRGMSLPRYASFVEDAMTAALL